MVVVATAEQEWMRAHRALSSLAHKRAAADAKEGRWLLAALRSAAHAHMGFASFAEYVERLFGYNPRATQEKLRVAEALERLPTLAAALEDGRLNWSTTRELTRVSIAATEREWLDIASGKTARQIEALVAGAKPGDLPSSPRDPSARRHVLRFEVKPETLALFREAMRQLRRSSDARLDDDALLLAMARAALGGPGDDGRSSYQVSLSVCPQCHRGAQMASGELVPVGDETVEMAQCDGQQLGHVAAAANDTLESSGTHVGAARAKQTIPPALRRTVLQGDRRRCRVPGCCNATFLDLHHIVPRAEGGRNDAANLLTLCGAHHRAAHRSELVIEGNAAGAGFRHADGSLYGEAVSLTAVDVRTKVFRGLRNLGFREVDVRRALAELLQRPGASESAEELLRRAIAKLTQ
jgi:hypothetical protein